MSYTAITLSANRKAGILDNNYLAQSAIAEGNVVVHGANDGEVILPTAANIGGIAGVSLAGGQAGATTTAGTDVIAIQWHGRAKCNLLAGASATRGNLAVVANTSGDVQARTQYSTSAEVLGTFAQSKTAGSSADAIEVDLAPAFIELCMPITGYASGALSAATQYLASPTSGSHMTSAVPLYAAWTAQKIRNLYCSLSAAPGGSDTVVVTVFKSANGGSTWTATSLTATISSAATSASDITHVPALAAGDLLALCVSSSATTASGLIATFQVT